MLKVKSSLFFVLLTLSLNAQLNSNIEQKNNKYGIVRNDGVWIVEANYDTIFKREIFDYRYPDFISQETILGKNIYVLINFKDQKTFGNLYNKAENVQLEFRKLNGEKIGTGNYDSYEFLDDKQLSDATVFVQNHALVIGEKGTNFLVEPGFTISKTQFKHVELYPDFQTYLVETMQGEFHLLNKRKEILLNATKITPLIDVLYYSQSLQKHILENHTVDLPYFIVENKNGEKQLYNVFKKEFVTPVLSKNVKFEFVTNLSKEAQGSEIDFRYFDNGKMGIYLSSMKTGTECKYKEIEFVDEKRTYMRVKINSEKFEELISLENPTKSYSFDEFIENSNSQNNPMQGLILKQNGKYTGFINGNALEKSYDSLFINSSNSAWFSFIENGKYGVTNGKSGINALFPIEIKLTKTALHPIHGEMFLSQELAGFYYDTGGNKHPYEKVNLMTTKLDDGKFILIEMDPNDDSKFVQINPNSYKRLIETNDYWTFIAQNLKGKWGIIDVYGKEYLPFIYDKIIEEERINSEIHLFTVSLKNKKARVNLKYGLITPLDEIFIDIVNPSSDYYFIETSKRDKNGFNYTLFTTKGEEVFPSQPSYESITTIDKEKNYIHRNRGIFDVTYFEPNLYGKVAEKYSFFNILEFKAYNLKPLTKEVEVYNTNNGLLEYVLSYEQYAVFSGFNVTKSESQYIVHYLFEAEYGMIPKETKVDEIDFVLNDGVVQLLTRIGKKWFRYESYDMSVMPIKR
ncbi:MAG: hypothetical protein V4622_05910 [Bacteroidota bacterium]